LKYASSWVKSYIIEKGRVCRRDFYRVSPIKNFMSGGKVIATYIRNNFHARTTVYVVGCVI
jgi:hypothetical protein